MKVRHVPFLILGAGAMGSATAYHLARRGQPVTIVEQFELGHNRGSSHGAARIIRHSYADPAYARLMIDAYQAWKVLEAEAGRSLYLRTGGISISPVSVDYVGQVTSSLESIDVSHRRMNGAEWNRLNPAFGLADDDDVVFEPDAGMIAADQAIRTQIELARQIGGDATEVLSRSPVIRIDLEGDHPVLIFDDFKISTNRLILTAGAWTGRLVPDWSSILRPTRQQVLYFQPEDRDRFGIGRFPVFIYKGEADLDAYYGMPEALGMGLKVARHGGREVDPNQVDLIIDEEYREEIRGFLRRTIPSMAESPIDRSEICLYTMAADENFRIGLIVGRSDVIVASPCSGHGFKFSCLIGRVLADLAIEGETAIDIGPWRV